MADETIGSGVGEVCTVVTAVEGTRVVLAGELDIANAPTLLERMNRLDRESWASSVVIDLTGLTFIDSSGLRSILAIARDVQESGGRLELIRGPERVMRIFEVSGLESELPFVDA